MGASKIGRNVYPAFVPSTSFTPFNLLGSIGKDPAKWIFPTVYSWVRPQCTCVGEPTDIQSPKNPRVKEAKTLLQRRQREKRNLILLEGQRLISDAISAGVYPQQLFMTREAYKRNEAIADIRRAATDKRALQFFVTDPIMQSITDTVTPQVCCNSFLLPTNVISHNEKLNQFTTPKRV